jgi:TRAP-type C4-dicarboxylate transport system substrate-binding protein
LFLAATVVVAQLAACQGSSVDKAGADTLVLQLATIDQVNDNGQSYGPQAFVDSLGEVSGGRLRVEVTTNYGDGAPEAESNLIRAIAAGELDGGWPSTRAFANAGITGLKVVEAPMMITNYEAEKALVSGPVAEKLLARLDGTGVVGLGLAVGPLRRPFAAEAPLLEPADWESVRFRVYNSPVQSEAVRALGGIPVNLSFSWIDEVRAGTLRGAEFDIAQYAKNDFTTSAGNVTANVVLWPKVFVLSFSQQRWDALTDQQRRWVQEAADRAVRASIEATYDETTPATRLCGSGVRFVDASPDQISDLRAALQPVLDQLATDPASGALLKDIQTIASEHPEPEPLALPDNCRSGTAGGDFSLNP